MKRNAIIAMGATLLMMAAVSFAQSQTAKERLKQKINDQLEGAEGQLFVGDVEALKSLGLTTVASIQDDEAEEICRKTGVHLRAPGQSIVAHPRSCFGMVTCTAQKYGANTVGVIATVGMTALGTYISNGGQVHWGLNNDCAADPCKTNQFMSDFQNCSSYIACKRDVTNGAIGYGKGLCPEGEALDAVNGVCKADNNCRVKENRAFTTLHCKSSPPLGAVLPGLTVEAYYNRTYQDNRTKEIFTQQITCPAGMVFDDTSEEAKDCLCVSAKKGQCPLTMLDINPENSAKQWSDALRDGDSAVTEETTGSYVGWGKFSGQPRASYNMRGLENNELAYNFQLSLSFVQSSSTAGKVVPLVSNSLGNAACPDPTFLLTLQDGTLAATVTSVDGKAGPVTSPVKVTSNEIVKVQLTRNGSDLILTVNNQRAVATGLGRKRLEATRCGLVFGQGFVGWMDKVRLVSRCDQSPFGQ